VPACAASGLGAPPGAPRCRLNDRCQGPAPAPACVQALQRAPAAARARAGLHAAQAPTAQPLFYALPSWCMRSALAARRCRPAACQLAPKARQHGRAPPGLKSVHACLPSAAQPARPHGCAPGRTHCHQRQWCCRSLSRRCARPQPGRRCAPPARPPGAGTLRALAAAPDSRARVLRAARAWDWAALLRALRMQHVRPGKQADRQALAISCWFCHQVLYDIPLMAVWDWTALLRAAHAACAPRRPCAVRCMTTRGWAALPRTLRMQQAHVRGPPRVACHAPGPLSRCSDIAGRSGARARRRCRTLLQAAEGGGLSRGAS